MPKSKQLLTSKYDNAKYLFPYFSLIKIIGLLFLELRFFSENFRKILIALTLNFCLNDVSR